MTVIKGKVVLIDEQNAMLAYVVQVVKIIKQGNKDKTTLDDFSAQLACWIEAEHCRQPAWQALK